MRRLPTPRLHTIALTALYLGFLMVSLLQQPGRTTYDTRLELTERPGSFLASTFSLWQADVNFGEVQNQASGYLFPQGPFFWLAHVLHVAPWITQRLWTTLIVVAACEGVRRLARALDLPASAAILAGLVFAFSPRLIVTSGVLTGEALPGAMAAWAVLPLVLAARGRLPARSAVVLSVAAAIAMGGVNAVETGAALVPAAVVLVWTRSRGLLPWRVVVGWLGGLVLATLWWTVPLVLLSRYSPPFYEYVESASTTTSLVGWSEAIRGDTHWLSWLVLPDGHAWWPAAHAIATSPALVVITAAVAAAGFVGLAGWESPWRVPFVFSAALGLLMLTVAHGGMAGTPIAGESRNLLDGTLQIFRNVHKFDPAVRIAVALGAGAGFARLLAGLERRSSWTSAGRWVVVPACLAMATGAPLLVDGGRTAGWTRIPSSWTALSTWLAGHDDGGGVLVAPASGFALQPWGDTFDEPALAVDVPRRVALTQAPLIPGATLRFLSAVTTSIASGGTSALADQLARAGITYVVLRQDLDQVETGTPTPASSETALSGQGFVRVATFGPRSEAPLTLYRVEHPLPRLRSTAADDVVTVAGEPETVLPLEEVGLAGGAVVLQGEPGWTRPVTMVTDGAERRERQFGNLYDARSVVLQANEPFRVPRAVHDYAGAPGAHQVVARYDGLASLRASSSRGYADTYGQVILAEGPAAAVDDSAATRWVSSPVTKPGRQWLQMKFDAPRAVHVVDVQPVVGDRFLAPVRELQVVAGDQRRTVQVDPDGGTVSVRFDGRRVRSVTVRVLRAGTPAVRAPVALASIHVEGLTPRATLVVPSPVTRGSEFLFGTEPGTRPCVISGIGPDCDEARRRNPEEPQGLDRTVHVRDDVTLHVGGLVAARLTPKALRLLEPLGRVQRVRASSVMGNDPAVASRFAWDGSPGTAWVPAPTDAGPSLSFRWPEARSVSGLRVVAPDPQASPGRALITTAEGKRIAVDLNGSAMVRFPAVRTHRLQITFERPAADARIVVGEVQLRGVDVTQPFDREAPTGAICGLGPHVTVDGTVYQTSVRGTLGDLVDGHPLNLSVCGRGDRLGSGDEVPLRAGEHRLRAPPTSDFQTVNLTGTPSDRGSSATARAVDLQSWNGTRRTARVGAGPATVVWMPANANVGWRARLDGRSLERITVDGWQQGWLLPSGGGGRLVIDFPAQGWYGGVVAGALLPAALVLALALLLVVVPRRGGRRSVPVPGNGRPRLATAAVVVLVVALGGVAAGGALLAWLARRRTWPVASAGLGLVVSGVLDAYNHPAVPTDGVADVIAAAAFGVVLATAVLRGGAGS